LSAEFFLSVIEIIIKEGEMIVNQSVAQEVIPVESVGRVTHRLAAKGSRHPESAEVVSTCHNFAEAVDWQFIPPSTSRAAGDGSMIMRLTENEAALRVGSFIGLRMMPAKDTLELKGGCFNMFYQPATVYEEFLTLSGLSPVQLEKTLLDMQLRLEKYYRNYVRA